MKLLKFVVLLAVLCLAQVRLFANSLEALLTPEQLWKLDRTAFVPLAGPLGFRWTSELRDSARVGNRGLSFLGLPVNEVVARFDGESVKGVTVLIYGRGDAGDMGKKSFEELIQKSIATLDKHTGKKFTPRGRDATGVVKADGVFWETAAARYTLEYSFTKENKAKRQEYRSEFIRLEIERIAEKRPLVSATPATPITRRDPKSQVKRDAATGDVSIPTVPMVDQGQKGYCAVACAERMFRYYGVEVDANEVAQVANSTSGGGTSSREMFGALKKLTSRFRVRVQAVEEFDIRDFTRLISDYNRVAKREKKPLLPENDYFIDVGGLYSVMDAEVLKTVRTKNPAETTRFLRNVQTHIDAGIPMLWSVQLGKFPEPGVPQSGGGHMRLIIGYNAKTNEILFSDSWGRGHELKRMPLVNAVTITTGLTVMEPVGT